MQILTHEDLKEELAFIELEPWPEEQTFLYLAQIAMMIAEIHRDRNKRAAPFQLHEFMFNWKELRKQARKKNQPISEDRIEEIFRALAEAQSARSVSNGDNSKPSSVD